MAQDFDLDSDEQLEARKDQWRTIKRALQLQRKYAGSDFLPNARALGVFERYWLSGTRKGRMPLVFRLWAHPDPDGDVVDRFLRETSSKEWAWSRGFWREMTMLDTRVPSTDLWAPRRALLQNVFGPRRPTDVQLSDELLTVSTTINFKRWWFGVAQWLLHRSSNPNYSLQDYSDAMWQAAPDSLSDSSYFSMHATFCQTANFVEPYGLRGDTSPQREFVERFKSELRTSSELPTYARDLWEKLSTRGGRAEIWESRIKSSRYRDLGGYEVVVAHGESSSEAAVREAGSVFEQLSLGVVDDGGIAAVDLSNHVSEEFAERLGYQDGEAIPAYRLRVVTTPEFVDSDRAQINVDVIAPVANRTCGAAEDAPALFLVPRPAQEYLLGASYGYELNYRLVQRTFAHQTGVVLMPYVTMDEWDGDEHVARDFWGPCYKADYQPLKVGRNALLDDAEHDFPAWEGEALPPLAS